MCACCICVDVINEVSTAQIRRCVCVCVWTRTSGTIQQLSGVCLCLLVCVYMSMRGLLNVCNSVCRQEFNSSNDGCECVCKLLSFLSLNRLMYARVCVCVLTCLLAHVCGQVWRTRAEVLVAVGQEGRQWMHPVRLLHHRNFVGLLARHKDATLI